MKETYNLYINGKFIQHEFLDIAPDEYRGGEPPSEISNEDGTIRCSYADDDDNFQ
jgi:hypothetical protein